MLGLSRSVCLLASLRKWVMISAGSLMRGRTGLPGGMVLSVSASSLVGVASSSGGGGKVTPRSDCHTHLLGNGAIGYLATVLKWSLTLRKQLQFSTHTITCSLSHSLLSLLCMHPNYSSSFSKYFHSTEFAALVFLLLTVVTSCFTCLYSVCLV